MKILNFIWQAICILIVTAVLLFAGYCMLESGVRAPGGHQYSE